MDVNDICVQIFSLLSTIDVVETVMFVCSQWRRIVLTDPIKSMICKKMWNDRKVLHSYEENIPIPPFHAYNLTSSTLLWMVKEMKNMHERLPIPHVPLPTFSSFQETMDILNDIEDYVNPDKTLDDPIQLYNLIIFMPYSQLTRLINLVVDEWNCTGDVKNIPLEPISDDTMIKVTMEWDGLMEWYEGIEYFSVYINMKNSICIIYELLSMGYKMPGYEGRKPSIRSQHGVVVPHNKLSHSVRYKMWSGTLVNENGMSYLKQR